MQKIIKSQFQCDQCKQIYDSEIDAIDCEKKQISHDKGVKIGDIVIITQGEGSGKKAKVSEIFILSKDYGHYAAKTYHHTVAVSADLLEGYGTRFLTFDSYIVNK